MMLYVETSEQLNILVEVARVRKWVSVGADDSSAVLERFKFWRLTSD